MKNKIIKKKITNIDICKMFLRSNFFQGSWNFERMQALGFCFSFIPVIRRLYPKHSEERKQAIKRHLEFFNTHPYTVAPILGIVSALEEQKANGVTKIDDRTINSIKIGLMGPLAGIGDPIFWGTIRPIFAALGAGIAVSGNILGPILFFVLFNSIRLFIRYYGIKYGYKKGMNIIQDIKKGFLQKITESASILGLFIMGALVNKWTHINISLVISQIKNPNTGEIVITTVQNILNQLMPGLIPLILTFYCMWLLRKKINPLYIIIIFFIIGILGFWVGFLS